MNSPTVDFSVAICTYNGGSRLPKVFKSILNLCNSRNLYWELVVVDNNSSDNTKQVILEHSNRWRKDSQVRYLFEPNQGVTYARQLALKETRSELIGFLDDDNLPEVHWLESAYEFGQAHPNAGAYGGKIHAFLDEPEPSYFKDIQKFLAVNDRGDEPLCFLNTDHPRRVPAAPGSVVRRLAWKEQAPGSLLLGGRDEKRGTGSGSCEDLEFMYHIQSSGWEVWYNPDMIVRHHIPKYRYEEKYLLNIAYNSGLSNHALRIAKRRKTGSRNLFPFLIFFYCLCTLAYLLVDGLKAANYYVRYRFTFSRNIGRACIMKEKTGKLVSPFWIGQP